QLLAIGAPLRDTAAAGRHFPAALMLRVDPVEGLHVDLDVAVIVGVVREPFAVGRKGGVALRVDGVEDGAGVAIGGGDRPYVPLRALGGDIEEDIAPVAGPIGGTLLRRAAEQQVGLAAVGGHDIEVVIALHAASNEADDLRAVRR